MRRFCAANRLNRLATLTYAGEGCFDQAQLREDVAGFFRGLRGALGGAPFPYLWVPEWHPGGHGLHAHFGVGRYVSQRLIRDVWGRGHVHITLIGDLPVGSGALEEARARAGYLGKYVSKNIDDERIPRLHRYEVAQGFQPVKVPLAGESEEDVIAQASERMGSRAGALLALGGAGGLAGSAGVLVCLGWMTSCAKRARAGPRKPRSRKGCPHESSDLDVLRDVCELLAASCGGGSDAPDRRSAVTGRSGCVHVGRADDRRDRGGRHDLLLPGQGHRRPLLAQLGRVTDERQQRGRAG